MNYRSNLTAPDLRPHFRLKEPPIQILGHDIPSDPDFEPNCGFWEQDEAAILYNVAKQVRGHWVDIGARFGWTTAHVIEAGCMCSVVDPILHMLYGYNRFSENLYTWVNRIPSTSGLTACQWFDSLTEDSRLSGFVIDGNHDTPEPLNDAMNAAKFAADNCVIMLHDYLGKPIRDAADWLVSQGWQHKVYFTPNGVCCCWKGLPDFVAPEHVRDPAIDWRGIERMLAE
jgi:hypothetical protein